MQHKLLQASRGKFYLQATMESHFIQLKPLMEELFSSAIHPAPLGVLHEDIPVFTAHLGRPRISDPYPSSNDTRYNLVSLTKIMIAGVVANLVAQAVLKWDKAFMIFKQPIVILYGFGSSCEVRKGVN